MKNINNNYEKNIRFYLDTIFKNKNSLERVRDYEDNPSKNFIEYIKQASGDVNYKFASPMSVFWNLSSACNFRCIHCLYNDTEYANKNDLTTERASLLADELIEAGVVYVVLSGGEIFMRPDLLDIVKKFKSNNVAVRLLTNASLLDDKIIDELAEVFDPYVDAVSVSLDGATNETFKKIRQTESFEKIVANIKKMTQRNIKVSVVCTVNSVNYSEVVDIYRLSKDLGVYNVIVGKVVCYNDSHESLTLSNEDLFELYYKLSNSKSEKTLLEINFWSPIELLNIPEVAEIIDEEYYNSQIKTGYTEVLSRNCQCHDRLAIDADGTVYLCLEAIAQKIAPLGSLKNTSLNDIWENRNNNILFCQRHIEDMVCDKCKYNVFCNSGCMVKAYSRTKDCNTPQIPCYMG